MAPATVADLIAHLQTLPGDLLVMLEAHPGGLVPIQSVQVTPVVPRYFKVPRTLFGCRSKQLATDDGWGPHCPSSYARDFPRAAEVPMLVLGLGQPGSPLPARSRPVVDLWDIEYEMQCFQIDRD